jgi:hypothetical protein
MTFRLEIMLRHDQRVFTDHIEHLRAPSTWDEADAGEVVRKILGAIDRLQHPGEPGDRPISLRGVSWIVNPCPDGVVIALEIHSASAVAGPFAVELKTLEALMTRAMSATAPDVTVH